MILLWDRHDSTEPKLAPCTLQLAILEGRLVSTNQASSHNSSHRRLSTEECQGIVLPSPRGSVIPSPTGANSPSLRSKEGVSPLPSPRGGGTSRSPSQGKFPREGRKAKTLPGGATSPIPSSVGLAGSRTDHEAYSSSGHMGPESGHMSAVDRRVDSGVTDKRFITPMRGGTMGVGEGLVEGGEGGTPSFNLRVEGQDQNSISRISVSFVNKFVTTSM